MKTKPNVRGAIGVENHLLLKHSRLANEVFIEVRKFKRQYLLTKFISTIS
jgi:hypothetical protein